MSNHQIVAKYVKDNNGPAQGSLAWLSVRGGAIGGSDMSTIVGSNHFKTLRDLVMEKAGMISIKANFNMWWGTVLERLSVQIFERMFSCKVHELPSIEGVVPYQRHSPDGLAVIDSIDHPTFGKGAIYLLEIKTANKRVANGKVPDMYMPQVLAGLSTVKIAHAGLFVDCTLRCCSPADFVFNRKINKDIHTTGMACNPMALYYMWVYSAIDSPRWGSVESTFEAIVNKEAECIFSSAITTPADILRVKPALEKRNNRLVATIHLKLFKFEVVPVDRVEGYVEQYAGIINDTIINSLYIKSLPDGRRESELERLYPIVSETMSDEFKESMYAQFGF